MRIQAIQPGGAVRPYTPFLRRESNGPEAAPAPTPHEHPAPGWQDRVPPNNGKTRERGLLELLEKERPANAPGVPRPSSVSDQLARLHNNEMRVELYHRATGLGDRFAELADTLLPEELQTKGLGEGFGHIVHAFEASIRAAHDDRDLQTAFDTLHASTLMLFAPQGEQPVAGGKTEEPVYPKEIPSPLAQFMSELASTFSDTISELAEVMANDFHPVSSGEPSRENAAYETLGAGYDQVTPPPAAHRPDHLDIHA